MNFKTVVLIFGFAASTISQVNSEKVDNQPHAQVTTETAILKSDVTLQRVKVDLISASRMSEQGAVLFGVGSAIVATGSLCMLSQFMDRNSKNDNSLIFGSVMFVGGLGIEFTGKIIACAGGSKARNALRYSLIDAPKFYGWPLFLCSAGILAASCVMPPLLIGDIAMSIVTVVHSVHYAQKACKKMNLSPNVFSVYPTVSMSKDKKTLGLVFNTAF